MAEAKPQKKQQQTPTKVRKPWQSGQYTVYLWEFLFGLLQDPQCSSLITWTNKESKEFRINNAHEIATLWGTVKNRPTMDDKKLLRALRYYYKTKILRKIKGHKGVYQFLSIPYETERCDQEVKTSSKPCISPPLVSSPEHSLADFTAITSDCSGRDFSAIASDCSGRDFSAITSDCSERLSDHGGITASYHATIVDYRKCTESNAERTVNNREQTEDDFDESYLSREETSSEYSTSSDHSSKSLEELELDFLTTDILSHMTENMDFMFNDDINNAVGMYQNGELLDWQNF